MITRTDKACPIHLKKKIKYEIITNYEDFISLRNS